LSYDWAASLGLILVFAGFAVIFAAIAMAVLSGGRAKGGGIILIGPFPIVFGSDAKVARSLMYLAIALIVIFMVLSFLLPFMFSGGWRSL
jgi:uncharacterized protein (TIGR00304 family)